MLNTEDSLLAPQGLFFKWVSPDPFYWTDWKIYLPRSSDQWPISWTEYYLRHKLYTERLSKNLTHACIELFISLIWA